MFMSSYFQSNIILFLCLVVLPKLRGFSSIATDQEVMEGQEILFSCSADGIPQPSIFWFRSTTRIFSSLSIRFRTSNDTTVAYGGNHGITNKLSIQNVVQSSDSGIYRCIAQNQPSCEMVGRNTETDVLTTPFEVNIVPCKSGFR